MLTQFEYWPLVSQKHLCSVAGKITVLFIALYQLCLHHRKLNNRYLLLLQYFVCSTSVTRQNGYCLIPKQQSDVSYNNYSYLPYSSYRLYCYAVFHMRRAMGLQPHLIMILRMLHRIFLPLKYSLSSKLAPPSFTIFFCPRRILWISSWLFSVKSHLATCMFTKSCYRLFFLYATIHTY